MIAPYLLEPALTSSVVPRNYFFDPSDNVRKEYVNIASYSEKNTWQYEGSTVDLVERFQKLANKWRRETQFVSSVDELVMHPCYQQIMAMGPDVISMILADLQQKPAYWFWALQSLTGKNPVTPDIQGDIEAITEAWLSWGKVNGYC